MAKITKAVNIGKRISKESKKLSELYWTKYTVGYDFGCDKAYDDLIKNFTDKKNFEVINDLLEKDLSPIDRRRVELLHKSFKPFHRSDEINELSKKIKQLTMKISGVNNKHRNKIDGKDTALSEIYRIMAKDTKEENRKKAYHALSQVNKPLVDNGFLELIDLRKEYAKLSGEKNFVEFKLKEKELDINTFKNWKKEVGSAADKIKKSRDEYAQKYLNLPELKPWNSSYLSSKIAPLMNTEIDMSNFYEPIRKLYSKFGFDITKNNVTYDIFPRQNKSEWGYFFSIDSKVDSRILANVQNRYAEFGVLLHETGHALHDYSMEDKDDLLNYGVSDIISEGFANFFGSYLYEEMFYKDIIDKKQLKDVKKQIKEMDKWNKINKLREVGAILFDHELYKTNLKTLDDVNQLRWKIDKELYKDVPHGGEPNWGTTIHYTTHPMVLHSYTMGDATFEMIKQVFCKKNKLESVNDEPEKFGKFMMKEVIKPSGLYTFNELYKRISGEEFSLKYLK